MASDLITQHGSNTRWSGAAAPSVAAVLRWKPIAPNGGALVWKQVMVVEHMKNLQLQNWQSMEINKLFYNPATKENIAATT